MSFLCSTSNRSNGSARILLRGIPLWLLLALCSCAPPPDTFDRDLEEAVNLSAGYLTQRISPSGMFEYRVNMNPDIRIAPKYNIVRHAGALYALNMHIRHTRSNAALPGVLRAGEFLFAVNTAPPPAGSGMLAVWSIPRITRSKQPLQAKLGAGGLGLTALLGIDRIMPGLMDPDDLRELGIFLLFMQREDGSFFSKYIPSKGGKDACWRSLYYPGEAVLGLLNLHEADPHGPWAAAAVKGLARLSRPEPDKPVVRDHWTLLAMEKLFAANITDMDIPEKQMKDHARRVCTAMLEAQITETDRPELAGGFSKDGRTTPTATNLEGLLAACTFLPADDPLLPRIRKAARLGLDFLLRTQIKGGKYAGGMPRAVFVPGLTERQPVKFQRRVDEIRIDYVQHAMSAMMQYLELRRARRL